MSSNLQVFNYEDNVVRTVQIDGEPWLVAKDVCDILGLTNPTMAVQELDDDEKMTLSNTEGHSGQRGGAQMFNVINEAGLYKLTFKSRKPAAKKFTRWVTHEVLPTLRKTGSYSVDVAPVEQPATPKLPEHSGVIKAAERIVHKAFKCKAEKDYQEVMALDAVFIKTFGVSALELSGLRLVKHDEKAEVDGWLRDHPAMEKRFGWTRCFAKVYFTLEHDYPRLSDE